MLTLWSSCPSAWLCNRRSMPAPFRQRPIVTHASHCTSRRYGEDMCARGVVECTQDACAWPKRALPARLQLWMRCHACHLARMQVTLDEQLKFLQTRIRACKSLVMKATLKQMTRVLRRLGHINTEGVVQTKGRVACEINTADELLCTELIFTGVFNDLDPGQVVCAGARTAANRVRTASCTCLRACLPACLRAGRAAVMLGAHGEGRR
ncbi:hypothetical protein EON66_11850 [archaeon]|nr:MAG: hypothetical protein EON66_11850 [archaeon]